VDGSLLGLRALIARALWKSGSLRASRAGSEFLSHLSSPGRGRSRPGGCCPRHRIRRHAGRNGGGGGDLAIEGDPLVLAAVVNNLLQNAFKFTRPHTTVTAAYRRQPRACAVSGGRSVRGLPGGGRTRRRCSVRSSSAAPIAPASVLARFQSMGHGREWRTPLYRNVAGGCAFIVDLPRLPGARRKRRRTDQR
jgi:hypothetical protein